MASKKQNGFTLIELLVVIAIIAVLAAILFPVFIAAKERARATKCLSNMRQIGTAIMLYLDSNNDTYPVSAFWECPPHTDKIVGLVRQLNPYIKNRKVWRCPDMHPFHSIRDDGYYIGVPAHYAANTKLLPYVYRGYLFDGDPPGKRVKNVVHMSRVLRASKIVAVIENRQVNPGMIAWWNYRVERVHSTGKYFQIHYDGFNCTYADGHAGWNHRYGLNKENFIF